MVEVSERLESDVNPCEPDGPFAREGAGDGETFDKESDKEEALASSA